jgi:peroxiredoxin
MILLVARLLLAAVFAVAGLAKLGRRTETESTLAAFGVAPLRRRPIALALPAVELAVAAALLPAASAPYAGVAAALLLALFSFEVARVLAAGEQVDCNCFGSLGVDRITRWTLVRNVAFLIPALIVATAAWGDPGPSAVAWVGDLGSTAVAAVLAGVALAVAALAFALAWQVMRQNGRLLERLEALEDGSAPAPSSRPARPKQAGKPVPAFSLPGLDGATVSLDDLLARDRELVLIFSDPACHACNPLLPDIGRLQRAGGGPLPVVMSLGDAEANRAKAAEHELGLVLLQEDFELARALGISGMPGAVRVDRGGRIAGEPVEDSDRVAELLTELLPALAPDAVPPLEVVRAGGAL